jgi:flagellar biogenesis protein FliO
MALPQSGAGQPSYPANRPEFRGPPPAIEQFRQPDSIPLAPKQSPEAALPLAPRGRSTSGEALGGSGSALLTTLGSLALVLCLFFAVAYALRRGTPRAHAALPGEVVEILGRAPLPGRHQMHLVRCGHKLLLVAVSAAGADTLTEITDAAEVDRLCGLCHQHHPHSTTTAFRNILDQFGGDKGTVRDAALARTRSGRKTRLAGASEEHDA